MKHPYEDILHLPHHVSKAHPQMPLMSRAVQFSPFAALTGYEAAVEETARLTDEKLILDEGQRQLIGERLSFLDAHLKEGPGVIVTYFLPDGRKAGGAYLCAAGRVRKLDPIGETLVLDSGQTIPFDDIYSLEVVSDEQSFHQEA